MSNKAISCTFSLLDEGRKYSGQHRKYVIENAQEICYSPETKEKIRLREALGYYGHGRRVLTGHMELQEVDVINLPDGSQAMVSNVPSNVTTAFDVSDDGTVKHTQEILDTETGRIVNSLHASKVGGFSWACPGEDGGQKRATKLTGFAGFDYVLQPGFAKNRGYVLESAYTGSVLEAVNAVVRDENRARQLVMGWQMNSFPQQQDSFRLEENYIDLQSRMDELTLKYIDQKTKADRLSEEVRQERNRCKMLAQNLNSLPIFIKERDMHNLLEGDFNKARLIFEAAKTFDYSQYPNMPTSNKTEYEDNEDVGSTGYGFKFKL